MAGIIIATASYDRSIRLWDAASTRCVRMIAPPKEAKNESVRPFLEC
jgi:WD40 repeat protein